MSSEDGPPKSAYELAMERLRKKDKDEGVEARSVSAEEKAKIAEIRQFYEAKLAEREILHKSSLQKAQDPESFATLEDEYRRDRERMSSERDSKIEKVRAGKA